MNNNDKIYWHEAFFEALKLELIEYEDVLEFINEYKLSDEALRMDALVVKKEPSVIIKKNIGRFFRGHNIFEYKSEQDSLSVEDYHKIMAYVHLYVAFERVPITDITLNIVVARFPRTFLKYVEQTFHLQLQDTGDGVYYLQGDIVPIQVLVGNQMSGESNVFLKNLRRGLTSDEMIQTLNTFKLHKPLNTTNVFLDRLFMANTSLLREMKIMTIVEEFTKVIGEIMTGEDSPAKTFLWNIYNRKIADDLEDEADNETKMFWARLTQEKAEQLAVERAEQLAEQLALETAKRLLSRGFSVEEAADVAGLDVVVVRRMRL